VLYFAQARDAAGGAEETIELPDRSSVRSLVKLSGAAHAQLRPLGASMKIAVNEELADESEELKDGDVVAFLPPVAGG
jgi:sulfur-carrier protein